MASWVDIANDALAELGAEEIQSLDDAVESARVVKRVHLRILDQVLAEHPWKCALVRVDLAEDAAAPAWGFANQYTLPADPYCLRPWRLDPDTHGDAAWKTLGRKIHTDEGSRLKLEYIGRVTDPEQLSPWVARLISARIAGRVAYRLTQNRELAESMKTWGQKEKTEARSLDAQQGTTDDVNTSTFLDARI